jgi:hypothetical protein
MASNWNRKPRWVKYAEEQEARREAARYERTHNLGSALHAQEMTARKSEQYQTTKADTIKALAQLLSTLPAEDTAERVEAVKALGGMTAITMRIINTVCEGKTYSYRGEQVALANLLKDEMMNIRNTAIMANRKGE